MTVITVGISELRKNFGKYMRRLKSGETIFVTWRGKSVAKFIPVPLNLDEKLQSVMDVSLTDSGNQQISDLASHNRDA